MQSLAGGAWISARRRIRSRWLADTEAQIRLTPFLRLEAGIVYNDRRQHACTIAKFEVNGHAGWIQNRRH
jgi:hypothetical protein